MNLTSSMKITISASGTTQTGLLYENISRTLEVDIGSGGSPYTHNIRVGNFSCFDGEGMDIILNFPASNNPTINVIDAWSNLTLASPAGSGVTKTSKVSIFYCATTFAWRLKELS